MIFFIYDVFLCIFDNGGFVDSSMFLDFWSKTYSFNFEIKKMGPSELAQKANYYNFQMNNYCN